MLSRWIEMRVDGQTMERPEASGRYPAVAVIQEVWGVTSHIQGVTCNA